MIPWAIVALLAHATTYPGWIVAGTVGGTIFVYYIAYEGLHHLMHKPQIAWIERAGFFKFIKNHHRLHHVYMGKNFNVVLPLADLLLGTLVLADPQPSRPTEPAARQVARRHSAWGRKLRAEATGVNERAPQPDSLVSPPES
jgi:sterol desaturase/sphingolipid hydroxylase (fatty acid hydroxylase superfamily)